MTGVRRTGGDCGASREDGAPHGGASAKDCQWMLGHAHLERSRTLKPRRQSAFGRRTAKSVTNATAMATAPHMKISL